ncbi:type II toxin-antitoxin system RelE/ParE family toxin [Glaesserella parasuis]|uniref:Uncharacterized protein n=1 Tax=Glaesserella parasuis TaxID=738 RepID=A0A084EY44_GLAPU|nr:type II toxin-antitoxin system RelE/ParE family toxin [Glaesserella parasuis]EQA12053.1 hypothetical protein HPSSW140_1329 [Glaesserella parasuis SW140]KEZ22886.1 hypothetical protein HS327_00857 [Glaesserella parasuis]MCT8525539.1 type II toxin-antitoxin system RelE/ParE family toxin [Glaesserella parasuis]MCT8527396.1 type II toxin-antitoxin system RelE/ParE family toxin [Glaesserella parasuis]MCT8530348.1 type II toxin-antitoxin system RelE/ParE family toxin [Glaesserella parasuis]
MRIFKSKHFDKFARKERISNDTLRNAINDIENGLIDADLGSGVIKQRLPKSLDGKAFIEVSNEPIQQPSKCGDPRIDE